MDRRQFALLLPAAGFLMGCRSEEEPPLPGTPINVNDERLQRALKSLASAIGDLEDNASHLQHGDWSKFVPKVEAVAADVRIAYEHLRQALGLPTN